MERIPSENTRHRAAEMTAALVLRVFPPYGSDDRVGDHDRGFRRDGPDPMDQPISDNPDSEPTVASGRGFITDGKNGRGWDYKVR